MNNDYKLEVNNLCKNYKRFKVLDNISFSIKDGEICGLVGENGSGKTTLFKILLGLSFKSSGEYKIFGISDKDDIEKSRVKIGSIIEYPTAYPTMTARQNLKIMSKAINKFDENKIDEIFKLIGLEDDRKKVMNFSLGMKQRLGIGLALLGEPKLLMLDEPLNGLDPTGIIEFRKLIKKLNKEMGVTIIVSSHILGELEAIATNYIFISKGKILEKITTKRLKEKCGKYISLSTSNNKLALDIIKENLKLKDIKVLDDEIRIYDNTEVSKVSNILLKENIDINGIHIKENNLEEYYHNLIEVKGLV